MKTAHVLSRRTFLSEMAFAGTAGWMGGAYAAMKPSSRFFFGACRGLNDAEKMKNAGFDFIENGVGSVLIPDKNEEAFKPQLEKLLACALPIRSCNGFLPKTMRLTGPSTLHDQALAYAETACRRADRAGIPFIVFGSGGARNAPEGFDLKKAIEQFTDFCRKLGDRIADCKVTVVLEPLNSKEANFLQTVSEGADLVDAIGKPRIRLLADFYHMRCEKEPAASILKAGKKICHCHIAEFQNRMAPGTKGEDFSDYFRALRSVGYVGGVSCECGWPKITRPDGKRVADEGALARALETMRKQSEA